MTGRAQPEGAARGGATGLGRRAGVLWWGSLGALLYCSAAGAGGGGDGGGRGRGSWGGGVLGEGGLREGGREGWGLRGRGSALGQPPRPSLLRPRLPLPAARPSLQLLKPRSDGRGRRNGGEDGEMAARGLATPPGSPGRGLGMPRSQLLWSSPR